MRILQTLNWNLKDVKNNLENINNQGFNFVQISPVQPLKEERPDLWWMVYQPISFNIGNIYGNEDDIFNLCEEAKKYGINIIADVVCNHMAGQSNGEIYPSYNVDPNLKNNPYFWKEFRKVSNWENRYEVTHYSMGLPSLNTENYDLQNIIADFLNKLIDLGINGFRFDAAKSIALPSEGCDFWPRVTYMLKKYGLNIYGEVIFDKDHMEEYLKYMKIITNEDYFDRSKIIKYVENHDSFYDLYYTKDLNGYEINNRYINLCQNYPNTLYFIRPFDSSWKDEKVRYANSLKRYK